MPVKTSGRQPSRQDPKFRAEKRIKVYEKMHLLVSCVRLVRSVRAKDNGQPARGQERE